MERSVLADDLVFPVTIRWYRDKVWLVDEFRKCVMTIDPDGRSEVVAEFDDRLAGLGFLPDGAAIVVLMHQQKIMRIEGGRTRVHADLSELTAAYLNDMVVDAQGRAYVDLVVKGTPPNVPPEDYGDCIMLVEPDGRYRVAATGELYRPNGLAITPDGKTLIVAELPKHRLTAFTIEPDGSLGDKRVLAETGDDMPDGICLDEEGAVWFGSPLSGRFVRLGPTGVVTQTIDTPDRWAVGCVLGGEDRKTLYMATVQVPTPPPGGNMFGNLDQSHGFIEATRVKVAGAGIP